LVYFSNYKVKKTYNELDKYFELRIKNYSIDGNHLTLEFNNLVGNYYFKTYEEKQSFINNYSLNDLIILKGVLSKPSNNTIPNTFNYKKYLYYKNIEFIINIDELNIKKKNKNVLYKIKNYIYKRINIINNNSYLYAFILGESK
jgi:predicted membrane metal-binding protein